MCSHSRQIAVEEIGGKYKQCPSVFTIPKEALLSKILKFVSSKHPNHMLKLYKMLMRETAEKSQTGKCGNCFLSSFRKIKCTRGLPLFSPLFWHFKFLLVHLYFKYFLLNCDKWRIGFLLYFSLLLNSSHDHIFFFATVFVKLLLRRNFDTCIRPVGS